MKPSQGALEIYSLLAALSKVKQLRENHSRNYARSATLFYLVELSRSHLRQLR